MATVEKVSQRIRLRILKELRTHQQIIQDEKLVDEILETTIDRMDDLIKQVVAQMVTQRVALGKRAELRDLRADLADSQADSATLALNLDHMRWDDPAFMVEHLKQVRSPVLRKALEGMPSNFIEKLAKILEEISDE